MGESAVRDTIGSPGAVMVHPGDASATVTAMVRSRRLVGLAFTAPPWLAGMIGFPGGGDAASMDTAGSCIADE